MMKSWAVVVNSVGGPEKLTWAEVEVPPPGPGEALLRHTAIGLNMVETYQRSGLYKAPLPFIPGNEAAGVIEELGPEVTDLHPRQRVAYASGPLGAYTQRRTLPASVLVPIPDGVDDRTAAASLLKGMTAEYLLRRTYRVQAGDPILWHAAAGGVGLIACQWAKHLGALVIGTAGGAEKISVAREHGCDHVLDYRSEPDFAPYVRRLAGGKGVPVVYDSVGRDTLMHSLECLRPRGLLVAFGNASGAPAHLDLLLLSQMGSLYVTRPTLRDYVATREELLTTAHAVFDVIQQGVVKVLIGQTFPLSEAAAAHRALEGRKTIGSTVLLP